MDKEDIRLLIDEPIAKLNKIIINFQKAPNRAYSRNFLIRKKSQALEIYNLINDRLAESEDKFLKEELNFLIKGARQKYNDILIIINEKLVYAKNDITSLRTIGIIFLFYIKLKRKQSKMALVVDVKLGTSLIPIYDGKSENLDSFIDAVRLFEDTVIQTFAQGTPAQKAVAAQTVTRLVRTRLTDKARQTINENQSLDEMLVAIRAHCESKVSADSLVAKLNAVKQNGDLTEFCDKVDKICSQLKSVYLKDEIPQVTANKMSTKCGINALIRGTRNNDAKIILQAGSFDKLSDAIVKLMEHDTQRNESATTQILTANRVNLQNRGRGSINYRGNRRGFSHSNSNQNNQNNFTRNNFSRGNYNNYRGNSYNRGYRSGRGYQNRGSFSHRGHPNQGMFMLTQQPQQQFQHQNIQQNQQNLPGYPQIPVNAPGLQHNFLGPPQGQFTQ